ncbi:MAG: NRDE family protein, partial [Cytophagales bacterium]|nr:NRDE family protein [Cytophagales bacterium]
MCLIFFAVQQHPNYNLVIAANRDEFYSRKTAPAAFWQEQPNILGGRDLEAKGTWMAMTKTGRISMVTNYRDPHNINPIAPSRGQLVSDYLAGEMDPSFYLKKIEQVGKAYNGFNLIVGNSSDLYYYSNYSGSPTKIEQGIHGLSNHLLDTPWPKVERGKEKWNA